MISINTCEEISISKHGYFFWMGALRLPCLCAGSSQFQDMSTSIITFIPPAPLWGVLVSIGTLVSYRERIRLVEVKGHVPWLDRGRAWPSLHTPGLVLLFLDQVFLWLLVDDVKIDYKHWGEKRKLYKISQEHLIKESDKTPLMLKGVETFMGEAFFDTWKRADSSTSGFPHSVASSLHCSSNFCWFIGKLLVIVITQSY